MSIKFTLYSGGPDYEMRLVVKENTKIPVSISVSDWPKVPGAIGTLPVFGKAALTPCVHGPSQSSPAHLMFGRAG